MRHADALSRSVNRLEGELALSKEIIRDEQEEDKTCMKYRQYESFGLTRMEFCTGREPRNNLVLLFQPR
jgi:hypothetical protein